jgi:hypothetical protein
MTGLSNQSYLFLEGAGKANGPRECAPDDKLRVPSLSA